ncbi:hypothetical protein C7964_11067 [Loktanella sp. PT4BL]|jgi:hypothetical protein|uniref:VRR-NUC domain-containing protein n=1 Tax=Loktanella sp. PT4BL TaxID=2135611 RepID=UPI000D75E589|nr:VRR-NUC domain-containing protein [Loktanella sp. PT4BL]PXW66336.1 hypothetical protein C7964_11067 [Loktanella sp. PT4BL]
MKRRGTPEADLQRAVVVALRFALPKGAIVHHCVNEVTEAGLRGAKRQAILVGMGVYPGFADLIVLCGGRVLFLELKSQKGRLSPAQEAFRDAILAQGFGWALVRSLDDALGALADHGFTTRVVQTSTPDAPRDAGARHDGTGPSARRVTQ